MKSYKTLAKTTEEEHIVQKSRFIAYAGPVNSEEEAQSLITRIKEKHREARHNCYAYIIGENSDIMRYNDDGEPSGTAGLPILETIKQLDLKNCVVVVTRYFGGILLGAGGLVRAYRTATSLAINSAGIALMEETQRILIELEYVMWNRLEHSLKNLPVLHMSNDYSSTVKLELLLRIQDMDFVIEKIKNICEARLTISINEKFYYPWNV